MKEEIKKEIAKIESKVSGPGFTKKDSERLSGLYEKARQTDLKGNPVLSKAEEAYLIFAEKQKVDEQRLDLDALKQIGLTKQEIKYLDLIYTAYKSFGVPAGSIKDDGLRYLIWDLDDLPRCNSATGKITLQSFLDSVGPYHTKDKLVDKKDYFCSLKYTIQHAEERENQDFFLLKIYKKIYKWCLSFESIHKLKEKETEFLSGPGKLAQQQAKEPEKVPVEKPSGLMKYAKKVEKKPAFEKIDAAKEFENQADENADNLMTDKQKNYIEILTQSLPYFENLENLDKFTKTQASSIIQILLRAPEDFEESFKSVVEKPEKVLIPAISC